MKKQKSTKKNRKPVHPDWATQHRKPGTELRLINERYYLYSVSSKYHPILKRAKKITGKLLGKITQEEGFVESSKDKLRQKAEQPIVIDDLTTKEYGAQQLVLKLASKQLVALEKVFGEDSKPLFLFSFFRLTEQSPIKNVPFYFMHSFLSEVWKETKISDKSISQLLRRVGANRTKIIEYQKFFVREGEKVLLDMTHVITHSRQIEVAQSGYSNSMSFEPQVNLMYLFSSQQHEPVYYRLLPGNIRDVKAFTLTMQECGLKNVTLIADKGFYSKKNVDTLDAAKLNYIIPLQRGSKLIPYPALATVNKKSWDCYFTFNEKIIWYKTKNKVTIYLNQELKIAEEKDYLKRVEAGKEKYSMNSFYEKQSHFGTLALINNNNEKSAEEIYGQYKARTNVETMFDALKNILDADRTYMQNDEAMEGWMFVNHIALQCYYLIYQQLVAHKLIKKYSVTDFLKFTHRIKKVKINGNWHLAEITKPVQSLLEKLKLDIT
ncbi:MAG: transposase [Bacteroidota bacterium]